MQGPKWNLLTAFIMTLAAAMWWMNAVRHGWGGAQIFCAVLWSILAVVWWVRWFKSRKTEENSDTTGGNENE
jgi:hypothetical protein